MTDHATRDGGGALADPPRDPADPAESVTAPVVAALWLDTLERLAARAAHPLRNALNGALLNVEVVRSRSGREGPATALASFATAAAGQVEHAAAAVAAVLACLRPEPTPADAATIVRRVEALLREPAGHGTRLELEVPLEALVDGSSDVARVVIVRTLLDCLPRDARARCVIRTDDAIFLALLGDAVIDAPWDAPLAGLASAAGITRTADEHGVTVRLPRAPRATGVR